MRGEVDGGIRRVLNDYRPAVDFKSAPERDR